MKSITLNQAIEILENAAAVMVDGSYVTFPTLFDQNETYFLCLARSENEIEETFSAEDNAQVEIDALGGLVMTNTNGVETIVMPLVRKPVTIGS